VVTWTGLAAIQDIPDGAEPLGKKRFAEISMQYDDFIDRVQQRAGLDSQERAVRAVRATLETLGERLSRMETRQLAAQLPNQLRAHFHARPESQIFPLEEFFKRVSARASVRQSEAAEQARAVIGVLREAVSAGEIEDVRIELAPEYDTLFGEEP
jgi:uncharacterized protein (DUF2267 family)